MEKAFGYLDSTTDSVFDCVQPLQLRLSVSTALFEYAHDHATYNRPLSALSNRENVTSLQSTEIENIAITSSCMLLLLYSFANRCCVRHTSGEIRADSVTAQARSVPCIHGFGQIQGRFPGRSLG